MLPNTSDNIPLARPLLGKREETLVLEVLRSGWLSRGPMTKRFEGLLASRLSAGYAAAVSSGTVGLHLCTRLANLGPGDEVITSPFSYVASANCILYERATPVFADIDPFTLNIDPFKVEQVITERTRALIAVDIFGYPSELDTLLDVCSRYGLTLIEDACQALGAEYKGRPCGSHGHLTVFAFFANKQITTGEGGMVVTGSQEEWKLLKRLSNQGRTDDEARMEYDHLGYNYRLPELSAALGVAQIEKLEYILSTRRQIALRYTELLGSIPGLQLPVSDDDDHLRSWFAYPVIVPDGVDREPIIKGLAAEGISASRYFPPIHLQPYMRERDGFAADTCPVAEDIGRRILTLPFFTQLGLAEQKRVADTLCLTMSQL
jgi:perosamine synthetase